MRSTFDFDPARPRSSDQRRQDRLKNKRSAARRADRKAERSRTNLASTNVRALEPSAALPTSAQPTSAAWTAVRCCRSSPGFSRFARMFSIRKGFPVTSDELSELRKICPPPSPKDPSIRIVSAFTTSVLGILILSRKPPDAECARFPPDPTVPPSLRRLASKPLVSHRSRLRPYHIPLPQSCGCGPQS
jgi:hypothetical protein